MTFLPTPEEKEFQDALRGFLAKEHDPGSVRRRYHAVVSERDEVIRSCREFGVFEWIHEGGARALLLTAREVGRALVAAPVVEDAFWGMLVAEVVPGAPPELAAARSGTTRVCGVVGDIAPNHLVVGGPGAQLMVRVCSEEGVIELFGLSVDAVRPVTCLDGSISLGELTVEVETPLWRAEGVVAEARFIRALWFLVHSAQVIGAAERCVELFQSHGTKRRQFGVPIAGFQAVQQQAAAHFAKLAAASALCSFGEWCATHDRDQVERVALSSWDYTSRIARPLAEAMVQIHGGIGFTWEYDLHLYLRRIVAVESLYRLSGAGERELRGDL